MLSQISNFFYVFPDDTFSTWKMEIKLCRTLFVEPLYIDQNPQTILELVEQFSRKLTICVFHSTCKSWKRNQNFGEKDKILLSTTHRIKGPLVFCNCLQPFCEIRWPNSYNKIRRKRKKKICIAKQNRMADICYRKPPITMMYNTCRLCLFNVIKKH